MGATNLHFVLNIIASFDEAEYAECFSIDAFVERVKSEKTRISSTLGKLTQRYTERAIKLLEYNDIIEYVEVDEQRAFRLTEDGIQDLRHAMKGYSYSSRRRGSTRLRKAPREGEVVRSGSYLKKRLVKDTPQLLENFREENRNLKAQLRGARQVRPDDNDDRMDVDADTAGTHVYGAALAASTTAGHQRPPRKGALNFCDDPENPFDVPLSPSEDSERPLALLESESDNDTFYSITPPSPSLSSSPVARKSGSNREDVYWPERSSFPALHLSSETTLVTPELQLDTDRLTEEDIINKKRDIQLRADELGSSLVRVTELEHALSSKEAELEAARKAEAALKDELRASEGRMRAITRRFASKLLGVYSWFHQTRGENARLEQELGHLRAIVRDLEGDVIWLRNERQRCMNKIAQLEAENTAVRDELCTALWWIDTVETELDKTRSQRDAARTEYNKERRKSRRVTDLLAQAQDVYRSQEF